MNESATNTFTDQELLRGYAEQGFEGSFRSLVARHANLVYSTALRGLSDSGAAAEVAQNVFILLARKGHWLCGETTVAPWLHRATMLEVRKWWRKEYRRQRREQAAAELGTLMKDDPSLLKVLEGDLDEGLLTLRETERTVLMLRYFEGLSHREIGVRVGAREDAVRMRINKGLERLTQFFRRRGYAVPAVATTVAALTAAVKAAPPGFAMMAAGAAIRAGGGGSLGLLKLLMVRVSGLNHARTAALCLGLAVTPIVWQWTSNRTTHNAVAAGQARMEVVAGQQSEVSTEALRLRAESARLDGAIADAIQNQARYESAAAKLEALKGRVRGMLTGPNYRWPADLPYARVAKSEVRSLDLLHKPGMFDMSGALNNTAQEMLGITAEEKAPVEQSLANYWHGVLDMMNAAAYQTNVETEASGRITDTVIVPPLGDPAKTLARDTVAQLSGILGDDREQLLFGDWGQGGIQIFAPGNLWLIGDRPQVFTVWVDPGSDPGKPAYGAGWHVDGSGISSGGNSTDFGLVPAGIYGKFFAPWLAQHGVTPATKQFFGGDK